MDATEPSLPDPRAARREGAAFSDEQAGASSAAPAYARSPTYARSEGQAGVAGPPEPFLAEVDPAYPPADAEPPHYLTEEDLRPRRRRWTLPLTLFVLTCLSTFWVGATRWTGLTEATFTHGMLGVRVAILRDWDVGLIYMACVLAILLAHEMGHFLASVRYRIPATLPLFIPMPIAFFGTMGAVIAMDGRRADRRQMFDIGIAGPLAGLVVAIPILLVGIRQLELGPGRPGMYALDLPLLVQWLLAWMRPGDYVPGMEIQQYQLNPYFMAGWIGLLITGLNMLPVSQLDGGHIIYTLFGKPAHWIARGFLFVAVAFVVFGEAHIWALMTVLVILIGADHPPTRDDAVPLGWFRRTLGYAALAIPILCFPVYGVTGL